MVFDGVLLSSWNSDAEEHEGFADRLGLISGIALVFLSFHLREHKCSVHENMGFCSLILYVYMNQMSLCLLFYSSLQGKFRSDH